MAVLPIHDLLPQAVAVAGREAVTLRSHVGEGIAGPALLIAPPHAEALGATLQWAHQQRLRVETCGGGTKSGWGDQVEADLILSTRHLVGVIDHCFGDLTAKVAAGSSLDAVNLELARHQQWIPLDPPWSDRATIGGIVATNDSGPRRHRYGAPRDLIIGIEFARADGTLAKAGGNVVKNVAGYDIGRLLTGSYGTLAVILNATFKLTPLAPQSRTVVIDLPDLDHLGPMVRLFTSTQLTPTAFELEVPPLRCFVRFESVEAAVDRQALDAVEVATEHGGAARIVQGDEESELWRMHAVRPWDEEGAVVKIALLPTEVAPLLLWIQSEMRDDKVDGEVIGRPGVGVLYLRLEGKPPAQARIIDGVRARFAPGTGHAVLLRSTPALRLLVEPLGPLGGAHAVMRSIKQQFDPLRILNPGRMPI